MDSSVLYSTDDVAIATALNLHGLRPQHMEVNGPKVWFLFAPTSQLTDLLAAYDHGGLTVPAKAFAMLYRDTVTRTRSLQQRQAMQQVARQ